MCLGSQGQKPLFCTISPLCIKTQSRLNTQWWPKGEMNKPTSRKWRAHHWKPWRNRGGFCHRSSPVTCWVHIVQLGISKWATENAEMWHRWHREAQGMINQLLSIQSMNRPYFLCDIKTASSESALRQNYLECSMNPQVCMQCSQGAWGYPKTEWQQ